MSAEYPNVECGAGHKPEPGYVVCGRVAKDHARVAEVFKATSVKLGRILCDGRSHKHDQTTIDDAVLTCAECARQRGWIK